MRDSYNRFLTAMSISKNQFLDFGMSEIIYAPLDKAKFAWEDLKQRIKTNQPVFIRSFGRNAKGSPMFVDFYKNILDYENVKIDSTGNSEPSKLIRDMTGYSKNTSDKYQLLRNYQVSHIFGRTKNIYMFTAPWNIVYLPKIIDPLTGHESKGNLVEEFQCMFQKKSYDYFKPLIEDYNELISNKTFKQRIDSYFEAISNSGGHSQEDIDKLEKSAREELTPIAVSKG